MIIRKREDKLEVDLEIFDKHLNNFSSYSITGIKERTGKILNTSKIHLNTRKKLKEKLQKDLEELNEGIKNKESDVAVLKYSLDAIEGFDDKLKDDFEELKI